MTKKLGTFVLAVVLTSSITSAQTVGPITVPTEVVETPHAPYEEVGMKPAVVGGTQVGIIVPTKVSSQAVFVEPPAVIDRVWACSALGGANSRPINGMVDVNLDAWPTNLRQKVVDYVAHVNNQLVETQADGSVVRYGYLRVAEPGTIGPGATVPMTLVRGLRSSTGAPATGLTTFWTNPFTGQVNGGKIEIESATVGTVDFDYSLSKELMRIATGVRGDNPDPRGALAPTNFTDVLTVEERILLSWKVSIPLLSRCQQ